MAFYFATPARPTICPSTVPDLRAAGPSGMFAEQQLALLGASLFRWDPASTVADDGATVIKPDDIGVSDPGRWMRVPVGAPPVTLEFELSGVYSAALVPGYFAAPKSVRDACICDTVHLVRRTAGSAGATQVDVLRNGASVYTLPVHRPVVQFSDGDDFEAFFPPTDLSNVNWNPGDVIEARMESVESFLAGPPPGPEGLWLRVYCVPV